MNFTSFDELKEYLLKDKERASLNPVRFINVESMTMWIQVKKLVQTLSDETISLSKYCDIDTTPNINRMISDIKKSGKTLCVIPISECLRIMPETADKVIKKLLNAEYSSTLSSENGSKTRIYFLMYRIKSVLSVIPNDDARKKDAFIYLDTDAESDYKLTIVQDDIEVDLPGNSISGFKKYLEYWEQNPDKPLILHTKNAIYFEKNHFFDDVHVIVTSYDLIKDQYDLPATLSEELGSNIQWAILAEKIYRYGNINDALNDILSTNKFAAELFKNWGRLSDSEKWALWIYCRIQSSKNYLTDCALKADKVQNFTKQIFVNIFEYVSSSKFDSVYSERKSILSILKIDPPESFYKKLDELESKTDRIKCLTNITDSEKSRIFAEINNEPYSKFDEYVSILSFVYPQLSAYLTNYSDMNCSDLSEEHYEYFKEYKWCKVTDKLNVNMYDKVKTLAYQKGASVFPLYTRNSYVNDNYDSSTAIFFADAMGIEYVDYLSYLFSSLDKKEYRVNFFSGICNLPSTTENNKDFLEGKNVIDPLYRALDQHKHSNCQYPDNIIKDLEIVEDIKSKVMASFSSGIKKIILTADHGSSRLAVLVRNTDFDNAISKPENVNIYEYGRLADGTLNEEEYPTAISYNDKLIFADYTRFKQMGSPIDEIHGGASLEEWIVPVVIIEKLSPNEKEEIKLTVVSNEHKINPMTQAVSVKFKVDGRKCKNIAVNINGSRIKCRCEDNIYSFDFKPVKGQTSAKIKVLDGIIIGTFEIKIKLGMSSKSGFDI